MAKTSNRLSTGLLKTVLSQVPFFFIVSACIFLNGCGDLGEDPVLSDARFSRTFRYYYGQDCDFDEEGRIGGCGRVETLSPSYVVRIRINGNGVASLVLDGTSFEFGEDSYYEGRDSFGGYFHFYESDSELTIYKDGSEMIIWDLENGIATFYSYEM